MGVVSAPPFMFGLPRAYWFLFAGTFVNRLGGFIYPFLSIYLASERELPASVVGLILSLHGAGSILAGPVGGYLADRIGRRPTMVASTILGAAAMLHLAYARAPWHLALGAFLLGWLGDLFRPAVNAAVSDLVPAPDRERAFGYLYWAVNLGFSAASIAAGHIARAGFQVLFWADACTTLVFGLLLLLGVPESRPVASVSAKPVDASATYRDGTLLAFLAAMLLLSVAFMQFGVALPLDMSAHGISTSTYGSLIAINGVLIVLLQPAAVRLAPRFARGRLLAWSALLIGVGFGLAGFLTSVPGYALGIVIWSLGEILMAPVAPSVIADLAPPSLRGSYQGAFHVVWGVSACAGPVLGGSILQRYGSTSLWVSCAVIGAIAALIHLAIVPARRRRLLTLDDGERLVAKEDGRMVV